ncbi:hypothetical protein UlMin_033703 [Ulmus minor]
MARYGNNYDYSYWDYFSIPSHLLFFMFILFFVLSFTWYVNYESKFEDFINNAKFFVLMVPLYLLLLIYCFTSGLTYLMPSSEGESLHRAGGSPWGVALLLVFLFYMISYQSSFHDRWFPLVRRS